MQKKRQAIARVLSLKTIAIGVSSSEEDPPAVALDDENLARHSPLSPTPVLFPTFVSPPRLIHVLEVPEVSFESRTASPSILRHLCHRFPTQRVRLVPFPSPNVPNLSSIN